MLTTFRISTFRWIIALGLLLAILASGFLSHQTTQKIEAMGRDWSQYQQTNAQKALILGQIKTVMGFEGVTHHFKNFILQGKRWRVLATHDKLLELKIALAAYRNLNLSEQERRALNQLEGAIKQYKEMIVLAEQMIDRGETRQSINAAINVDDIPASRAIISLENYLYGAQKGNYQQLRTSIDNLATFSYIVGSTASVVLILLGILFFGFTNRQLIHPLKRLVRSFENISPENPGASRLGINQKSSETELGNLVKVANRFIDSVQQHQQHRAAAEANLRDHEQRLQIILQHAADAIITIDDQGLLTSFNSAAVRMFGYEAQEVLGKNVSMLMPEPYSSQHDQFLDRYKTSQEPHIIGIGRDVEGLRKDGSIMPIRLAVSVIGSETSPGFTGIISDLTEHKRAEEQLLQAKESAELAQESAEKANQAKSEFLSSVSHELRTPLNAVLGFAQLLEVDDPALTERQQEYVDHITDGGRHLLSLINEILDLAKVEAGKMAFNYVAIDTALLLSDCINLTRTLAEDKQINIIDQIEDSLPNVIADHLRAKQILLNLLSNAVKYNREGGDVELITDLTDNGFLRISISDTGLGIAKEDQENIFQPFNRLTHEDSNIEGTGIGLAITQKLVHAMGGNIGLYSTLNEGSTFWVELPIDKGQEEIAAEGVFFDEQKEFESVLTTDEVHLILYVEDNPTNVRLMENVINTVSDMHLCVATTASDGIMLAEEELPDVIIMDIDLPDINGFDASAYLRENPKTRHIPIIALSANAMADDIKRGENTALFIDYMTKPFEIPDLMQNLNKALAVNKSSSSLTEE